MGIYDLLNEIEHPESLTMEEALELAARASLASFGSELSKGESYTPAEISRMDYDDLVYANAGRVIPDPALKKAEAKLRAIKRKRTPVHRHNDHSRCSICDLNRSVEKIIKSGHMTELDQSPYSDLKDKLELAQERYSADRSQYNALVVKSLIDKINNVLNKLTSSIGEHHA
ncbi:hypothetical protein D9M68_18330 [compost metagenome]